MASENTVQHLLTTKQAAARTGISAASFIGWRGRGEGPPYIKLGRSVRYKVSDLEAWIEANRRGGRA